MRDTFIAILVMAGLATGIAYLKKANSLLPHIESPILAKNQIRGGLDDPRRSHGASAKSFHRKKMEGNPSKVAENEGIPSIYQSENPEVPKKHVREKSAGLIDRRMKKKVVIHGVPVEAWVLSRRDSVPLNDPSEADDGTIRVFLQCMELKKHGPASLNERDCHALAALPTHNSAVSDGSRLSPSSYR